MNQLDLQEVCQHMSLGLPDGPPEPLFGGLIHKMWRANTEKGVFAIKELSALIKFDSQTKKAYEHSEEIARSFEKAGIPAIVALSQDDHSLIELKSGRYLCYPWIDGKTLTIKDVKESHLIKMAAVLAKIHQISLGLFGRQKPKYDVTSRSDLVSLFEAASTASLPYAALLKVHEKNLLKINDHYTESIAVLQKTGVMSHSDLDPKNVLWDAAENPHLIDWEAARPMNTTHDVVCLALDWSGLAACSINLENFRCVLETYKASGGNFDTDLLEHALFAVMGNSLNWLAFNIKRSVGSAVDQDEKQLAICQVADTIKSIIHLYDHLALIRNAARP